ncbi:hypothetical protein [Massilia glaciei]|nr:hypothetical protein [Massilia glaciei]
MILFVPLCAPLGARLADPGAAPPMFSGVFMEQLVAFVRLYYASSEQ